MSDPARTRAGGNRGSHLVALSLAKGWANGMAAWPERKAEHAPLDTYPRRVRQRSGRAEITVPL